MTHRQCVYIIILYICNRVHSINVKCWQIKYFIFLFSCLPCPCWLQWFPYLSENCVNWCPVCLNMVHLYLVRDKGRVCPSIVQSTDPATYHRSYRVLTFLPILYTNSVTNKENVPSYFFFHFKRELYFSVALSISILVIQICQGGGFIYHFMVSFTSHLWPMLVLQHLCVDVCSCHHFKPASWQELNKPNNLMCTTIHHLPKISVLDVYRSSDSLQLPITTFSADLQRCLTLQKSIIPALVCYFIFNNNSKRPMKWC